MAMDFADYFSGKPLNMEKYYIDTYGSIENLILQAKTGNISAQEELGAAYSEGVGNFVAKDTDKAIGWLNTAVENGSKLPCSVGKLGELFDRKGTPQHQQKAYEMYSRAAELGDATSQLNLAKMYQHGVEGVVNKDTREAFEWYKRAADEKPPNSQSYSHYLAEAAKKVRSIRQGDSNTTKVKALMMLYTYYLEGECPERRPQPSKAVHYLSKAAELGNSEAQRELGKIYWNGTCQQLRDVEKARRWFSKASDKGDTVAKQLLKRCNKADETPHQISDVNWEGFTQCRRVKFEKMKEKGEAKVHPFAIAHPVLFNEEMLIPLQSWSPTARIYLKAYKLVKKGFEILRESRFTDKKGISFIAYGYLTENSILQAFPQLRFLSKTIFQLSDQILQKNPSFLEALVVSLALQPTHKLSVESFKTTSKKRVCLMNLIRFIEVAEPNEVPCESSFEFDKKYSSWLHVLYYHIGSMEMIEDSYEAAAEAFENSLKCCPSYFDSKRGLGYALLQLYLGKRVNRDTESNKSDSPAELAPKPKHEQKALEREKSKYASYSSEQLRNASVCILKEFLQEAPSCFTKYPNAYYYLAYLAFAETNMEELRKYYELGQDAEEKRLPFHDPVDLPMKDTVSPVYQLFANVQIPRGCGNMACSKKIRKDELRSCACKKEKYCDRDCQRADWDRHKTTCSAKGKKAKNDEVCQNTASM